MNRETVISQVRDAMLQRVAAQSKPFQALLVQEIRLLLENDSVDIYWGVLDTMDRLGLLTDEAYRDIKALLVRVDFHSVPY